jgi:uncharacterized protein (DUF934 family)
MRLFTAHEPAPEGALALANTDDVLALATEVGRAPTVVLDFPKWTDGRAYSQAVLLRGRLRYAGEIRARGDVLVDMLPLLRRCGFDSAQLRADQNPAHADRTLVQFPGHYQRDASRSQSHPAHASPSAP